MKDVKGIRKNVNLICSYMYNGKTPSIIHDKQKNIISIKQFKGMTFKWKIIYNSMTIFTLSVSRNVGVDLNISGNLAAVGNPKTRDAKLLGEGALGNRMKYIEIRRRLQQKKYNLQIKRMGNKESRVMRSLNHKISRQIVDYALENRCNIKMEELHGIRDAKTSRSFRKFLHSWAFYQLRLMVEYKLN